MEASSEATHWECVYQEEQPDEVSWFEPSPVHSLELFEAAGVGLDAAIIDVGGGASSLAAELLARGHRDIAVADISASALEKARSSIKDGATSVSWIEADIRSHDFARSFDLWHDRAVFHFMVQASDRDAYMDTMHRHLRPGGQAIIATFGPQGPKQCSGLPVRRYHPKELETTLGSGFELLYSTIAEHPTPGGNRQQFLYTRFRRNDGQ